MISPPDCAFPHFETWEPADRPQGPSRINTPQYSGGPNLSFRGDAKHRTRNLEIPGLVLRTIPE
jgi:hypothetical protein